MIASNRFWSADEIKLLSGLPGPLPSDFFATFFATHNPVSVPRGLIRHSPPWTTEEEQRFYRLQLRRFWLYGSMLKFGGVKRAFSPALGRLNCHGN